MKKKYNPSFSAGFTSVLLCFLLFLLAPAISRAQGCANDTEPPVCIAPPNVTDTCSSASSWGDLHQTAVLQALFGVATATDNCSASIVELPPQLQNADTICLAGYITRRFLAADTSGNTSTCEQTVIISSVHGYTVTFPADYQGNCGSAPGDMGNVVTTQLGCEINGINFEDEIFPLGGSCFRIERTWIIVNWCSYDPNIPLTVVARRDLNGDGQAGDGFSIIQSEGNYYLDSLTPGNLVGPANNGFKYKQIILCGCQNLEGRVFQDLNTNCQYDAAENGLSDWQVIAEAFPSHIKLQAGTDAQGNYSLVLSSLASDTLIRVSLVSPLNLGASCNAYFDFDPDSLQVNSVYNRDFPVRLVSDCPQLVVDLATFRLRRCLTNTFTVSYGNYGGQAATNAYVDVDFDPLLDVTGSSIPWSSVTGNLYRFDLGAIPSGSAGSFQVYATLNCAATPGQLHCSDAHIYPDSLCGSGVWNGANVVAQIVCTGDSVHLNLKNVGTGDMQAPLEYLIVEDVIMYLNGSYHLDAGEEKDFVMVANGSTWHLAADQEPGNPFNTRVYSTLEGCGTNDQGSFTVGLAGQFPPSTPPPAAVVYCVPNFGSYDPNDKQGFPAGYGPKHYIEPNLPIEYMIRFQNTGNDTAFTVVLKDQLSPLLNPATVRPGASSHPYIFHRNATGALEFVFNNILLPDSTTNQAASQGFVKFRADQNPDLPDGSVIENAADIYFDFNAPVRTNTVLHTVGRSFISVSESEVFLAGASVQIYPNPFRDETTIRVDGLPDRGWQLRIFDLTGRIVWESTGQNAIPAVIHPVLAPGLYTWQIASRDHVVSVGKMSKQ